MRFLTPIDDHHSISCSVRGRDRSSVEGLSPFALPDGYIVDVRRPERGPENDFRIDRDAQRSTTFSGIPGGPRDQDRAMTETMEPVLDRSDEHLGTTDVAIIAMRRQLLRLARDLEQGIEPPMAGDPQAVREAVGFNMVSKNADFADVLAEVASDQQSGSRASTIR
jgi:hypothetical protein